VFSPSKIQERDVIIEKKGYLFNWMKLIVLNKRINISKEQNFVDDGVFGFVVEIKYRHNSPYKDCILYNCTQVHYGYTEFKTISELTKIAFESDIHKTGINRRINEIKSVVVYHAQTRYKNYHEFV